MGDAMGLVGQYTWKQGLPQVCAAPRYQCMRAEQALPSQARPTRGAAAMVPEPWLPHHSVPSCSRPASSHGLPQPQNTHPRGGPKLPRPAAPLGCRALVCTTH